MTTIDAVATPVEWEEYEAAAEWCARNGTTGAGGDDLPQGTSAHVVLLIEADQEAFARHVRDYAYPIAMEKVCRDESGEENLP